MIVDTSVVVAIARREVDADRYLDALDRDPSRRMSAGSFVELGIVAARAGADAAIDVDALVAELGITIEAVTPEHARIARDAFSRFGRGMGHPAQLNYGDTFAYALAVTSGEPLLFKGDAFGHTDIRSVLA